MPVTRAIGIVSFMRLRQRRKVDLPQPDGPMKADNRPVWDVDATSLDRLLLAVEHVDVGAI